MRSALQRCSQSLLRAAPTASRNIARPRYNIASISPFFISISSRQLHNTTRLSYEAVAEENRPSTDGPVVTKFQELSDLNLVHPNLVRTITRNMGLETMTDVQTQTINAALKGKDIIAQAKTGTGKTLAFLIPLLQNIITVDPALAESSGFRRGPRTTADDIRAIIISPTRELAEQIAVEAKRVVQGTGIIVQTAVGGTQKSAGLRAIQKDGCHVLVGTPGRLEDILTDEYSRVQAPDLSALVLDEADRLMDQGFWPDIQKIMRLLPRAEDRQTLMFSATVPKEVVKLVREALKPGFDFVQCVNEDDEPTHERVKQHIVVTKGLENNLAALTELCVNAIEQSKEPGGRPFKAIVYYNSAAEVTLYANVIEALHEPGSQNSASSQNSWARRTIAHPFGNVSIGEIHSRLSQGQRTSASERFRRCESGILFSSDVTARGLDFPDVTHVIQMGTPSTTEQYVHRIGRTARAGKEGEGWLIINEIELGQARSRVGSLPLKPNDSLETAKLDLTTELQVSAKAGKILSMLQQAYRGLDGELKSNAFKAMLGVFQAISDKTSLVRSINNLSKYGWGMAEPPAIAPALAQRLGLSRIPGVRVGIERPSFRDRGSSGDRGSDRFGSSRFGRDDNARKDPFGSFDRGSRGDFDRGSRGGFDRASRGGFERGPGGRFGGRQPPSSF